MRLKDWLRGGMLIQVTADSLTGHKGKHAQRMAHDLLEKRWVHFLATDAHNTTSGRPGCGKRTTWWRDDMARLTPTASASSTPLAVFLGKQFEVAEEPLDLFDEVKEPSWWQRVLVCIAEALESESAIDC